MRICEYGCRQEGKYYFSTAKKWCCSKNHVQCPVIRRKLSIESPKKGKTYKEIYGEERSEEMIKNRSGKNNPFFGKIHTKESMEKNRKANKGKEPWNKNLFLDTIEHLENKYPFFSQIEEMRYRPGEKEIQVHCKNHLCPNSKEKGGWFTPTRGQIGHRVDALENPRGFGESNFYCSQKCKDQCPLYGLQHDPFKETKILYTQQEYQTFRQFVLERDNYKCQYCDELATDVHHERPQKIEPFFALDPDLAWSCCEKCHYKYGHKTGTECSTGNLANLQCI